MSFLKYAFDKYHFYIFGVFLLYIVSYQLFNLFSLINFKFIFNLTISSISFIYLLYLFFRIYHSYSWFKKLDKINSKLDHFYNKNKKVGVCIPIYNETVENIINTVSSVINQSHPNISIYLIDDGSNNQNEIIETIKTINNLKNNKKISFSCFSKNKGKREVMYRVYLEMKRDKMDYYVTVDSDTIIDKNGIKNLLSTIEQNPTYASVTGHVLLKSVQEKSLLQKLIAIRYLSAFNIERASQSNYGAVQCNSGPFTIYRMEILGLIIKKFRYQTFLGKKATFGDDRHLTNRILELGYRTIYQPIALAYTDSPDKLMEYWRQQLRWSKSFVRESFWQLKSFNKQSFHMILDYNLTLILSFFLFFSYISVVITLFPAIFANSYYFNNATTLLILLKNKYLLFLLSCLVMSIIKGLYLKYIIVKVKLSNYVGYKKIVRYVVIYVVLYLMLLVFSKPIAFITPLNTYWGTRSNN